MRWLHLSDIHYNPEGDGRSSKQLRDKLPKYIRDNNIIVDHVFITGDYRHAGKDFRSEEVIAKEAVCRIRMDLDDNGQGEPNYSYGVEIPVLARHMSVVFDIWSDGDWRKVERMLDYFVDDFDRGSILIPGSRRKSARSLR